MKVSVVIPCFNAEAFIERAVRSVLAQTHDEIELICVDDGSTDRTVDKLKELQRTAVPSMSIITGENRGAGVARNRGVAASTGDYVQFLDADDELKAEKITADLILIGGLRPGMIAGAYVRKNRTGSETVSVRKDNAWLALFNGQLGCTCSNLFRRDVFLACGGWNETLRSSQEADLMLRILQNGADIAYNDAVNTIVHTNDSLISKREPAANLKRYFDIRLRIYDELQKRGGEASLAENAGYMFYGILHRMYRMDAALSLDMLEELKSRGIKIATGPGVSSRFRLLCTIFGFQLTEKLFY